MAQRSRSGWFGNRSIQTRWGLVFVAILIFVSAEGATNFYIFEFEQRDRELTTHSYDVLLQLSQLEFALVGQQSNLRGLTLATATHSAEDFREASNLLDQSLLGVGDLMVDDSRQQGLVVELRKAIADWRAQVIEPILSAIAAPNGRARALDLLSDAARVGRLRGVLELVKSMKTEEQQLLSQRRYSLEHSVWLIKTFNLAFLLVWLMMMAVLMRLSAALLSRPIHALADIITRLADRDYDVQIGWQKRGDEIGAIARALAVLSLRSKEADHQAALLRATGESLRMQAQQLALSNDELVQKTAALDEKNQQLQVLQRETQEKAQQLEKVSRYRADFVANTSHELRTPLNSMLILSKLLADNVDKRLNAEDEESARIIHESGSGLLRLINDILDLSKMEAGKLRVMPEEVLLETAIARWRRSFNALAKKRKIRFAVESSFDAPAKLFTDSGRLDQIVNNLISNAFKFTERGEVRVYLLRPPDSTLFQREELRTVETIAIRVSDTGIGVAEDQFGRVFEAFEQIEAGASRSYGGTGLGLAITRSLVELLGGEVQLESQSGKGSIFSVYLPVVLQSEPRLAPARSLPSNTRPLPRAARAEAIPSPPAAKPELSVIPSPTPPIVSELLRGRCLLIVADDMREGFLLARALREHGLRVLLAPSAERAFSALESTQIDWCLIDIDSEKLNGKDIILRVRKNPLWKSIRLITASGSAGRENFRDSRDATVGEWLPKPLNVEQIIRQLQAGPIDGKPP